MDLVAKAVFEYHNKVRQAPSSLIPLLKQRLEFFKGKTFYPKGSVPIITNEGSAAIFEAIAYLEKQKPLHPLKWSEGMAKACLDHAKDIGSNGSFSHISSDNSTLLTRLSRHGQPNGKTSENISFGPSEAEEVILFLIIDDGNKSRAHRKNFFSPDFNFVGVASAEHTEAGYCFVIDYAEEFIEKSIKLPKSKPDGVIAMRPEIKAYTHQTPNSKADTTTKQVKSKPIIQALFGESPCPTERLSKSIICSDVSPNSKTHRPNESFVSSSPENARQNRSNFEKLAKEVFDAQNRLRKNPSSFIELLEDRYKYFDHNTLFCPGQAPVLTSEGPRAVEEAIEFLKTAKPLPEFEWKDNIARACRDHAQDIGPKGLFSHTGSDGSNLGSRLNRYGKPEGQIAENLTFGAFEANEIIMNLLVDDGNPNRSHRMNIFSPNFRFIGVAAFKHAGMKVCVVINYTMAYYGIGEKIVSELDRRRGSFSEISVMETSQVVEKPSGLFERKRSLQLPAFSMGDNVKKEKLEKLPIALPKHSRNYSGNLPPKHEEKMNFAVQDKSPLPTGRKRDNLNPSREHSLNDISIIEDNFAPLSTYILRPLYEQDALKKLAIRVFELQNHVRQDPLGFVPVLENYLKHFKGNELRLPNQVPIMTKEGPTAVTEVIEILRQMSPVPEILWSSAIAKACQEHGNEIGTSRSPYAAEGDFSEMLKKYSMAETKENVYFGSFNPEIILASLLVDDGDVNRDHRQNILSPKYKSGAVAAVKHPEKEVCVVFRYTGDGTRQSHRSQSVGGIDLNFKFQNNSQIGSSNRNMQKPPLQGCPSPLSTPTDCQSVPNTHRVLYITPTGTPSTHSETSNQLSKKTPAISITLDQLKPQNLQANAFSKKKIPLPQVQEAHFERKSGSEQAHSVESDENVDPNTPKENICASKIESQTPMTTREDRSDSMSTTETLPVQKPSPSSYQLKMTTDNTTTANIAGVQPQSSNKQTPYSSLSTKWTPSPLKTYSPYQPSYTPRKTTLTAASTKNQTQRDPSPATAASERTNQSFGAYTARPAGNSSISSFGQLAEKQPAYTKPAVSDPQSIKSKLNAILGANKLSYDSSKGVKVDDATNTVSQVKRESSISLKGLTCIPGLENISKLAGLSDNDPDRPPDAVTSFINHETVILNGKRQTIVVKTYKLKDGSTKTLRLDLN